MYVLQNEGKRRIMKEIRFSAILIVIALVMQLSGKTGFILLQYQRERILSGELWRLLTGHLLHLSWTHMWMNLAALVLIGLIFRKSYAEKIWWLLLGVSMLGVDLGLLLFNPEISWYVGLSGALHGIFAGLAILYWRSEGRTGGLFLLVLVVKLVLEQWSGALPGSAELSGGTVIVDAHLYGAIAGGLAASLVRLNWAKRQL